jgi:hypothetical protein
MVVEGKRRTVVAGCTGSALSIVANRDGSNGTLAVYTTDANSAAPGARGGTYMTRMFHLACAVSGLRKLKVDGSCGKKSSRTCSVDDCGGDGADSAALLGCT